MSEPVIDQSTFDSLKEIGDADFINELIDTFLEDAPHMLDELSQALADKNAEQHQSMKHSSG